MIVLHRKEQWDILENGIENPLLVIGWKTSGHYARLCCIWRWGILIKLWGYHRLCLQIGG